MDIFISYARKDLARVAPIAQAFKSLGYRVWWDASLRAGRRFDEEIEQALAAARCVLVVWTEAAVHSRWVRAEAAEALDHNKLVPVFLEAIKPPLYFRHVHGVGLGDWDGRVEHAAFQRLLGDCAELVPLPAPQPPPESRETKVPAAVPDRSSSFRDRLQDGGEGPQMRWLPAGTFLMGSPAGDAMGFDDERPQHEVRIAQPFAIGRFPVTFADYDRFCAAAGRGLVSDQGWGRDRRPVISVSWEDAVAYCRWLAGQTGRDYRLPSEAEWEYACRAGSLTRWSFGDDQAALGGYAWFDGNAGGQTHPVGEKGPNDWGLHDMHGNVLEWVLDRWHDSYRGAPTDGRPWEDASGEGRVLRGGGWFADGRYVRSASRGPLDPGYRRQDVGFRLVLGPQPKPAGAGR